MLESIRSKANTFACVDIAAASRKVKTGSVGQLKNLNERGLAILRGEITDILLAKYEDVAEARRKRRIEATPRPIKPMVAAALRYLIKTARFLIGTRDPAGMNIIPHKEPVTHCGAFFVEKSNGKLRVILDGRYANVYFDSAHFNFSFFRLETLRNVIGNLSTHNKCVLPKFFRSYLGMILTDRLTHQADNHRPFYAFPRSLPMGWIAAPFLAQTCAWSIVLGSDNTPEIWKNESDVDTKYLDRMKDLKSPLPWVPLKSGGGIFVFLDNILVVTPHEHLARWWEKHIIASCHDVGAHLKTDNEDYTVEKVTEKNLPMYREMFKDCYVELTRDDEARSKQDHTPPTSFDFLGVRWTYNGRTVVLKSDSERGPLPQLDSDGVWRGKRREMAGILGKILWFRRVHGITYYDKARCQETQAVLGIYRNLAPDPGLGPDEVRSAWQGYYELRDPTLLAGLSAAWNTRAKNEPRRASPQQERVAPSNLYYSVTDAATHSNQGNGGLAGGVWYQPKLVKKSLSLAILDKQQVVEPFNNDIAVGEMKAILITVREVVARGGKLLILATDNLSCKYWIEKGHAKSPEIQEMLDSMHTMLAHHHCRLYVTYVNTNDNVADQLSRREPMELHRLHTCHALLEGSFVEATSSLWTIGGSTMAGIWKLYGKTIHRANNSLAFQNDVASGRDAERRVGRSSRPTLTKPPPKMPLPLMVMLLFQVVTTTHLLNPIPPKVNPIPLKKNLLTPLKANLTPLRMTLTPLKMTLTLTPPIPTLPTLTKTSVLTPLLVPRNASIVLVRRNKNAAFVSSRLSPRMRKQKVITFYLRQRPPI